LEIEASQEAKTMRRVDQGLRSQVKDGIWHRSRGDSKIGRGER